MYSELGDRMKQYEEVTESYLTHRVPVIVRVDGKSFSKLTSKFDGWSLELNRVLESAARYTMEQMQGCTFAYGQMDEASFLLTDYQTIKTDAWFAYNLRKLVSISAAYMTGYFIKSLKNAGLPDSQVSSLERGACFDSRAFTVPHDEVVNYFVWRQRDATRNAIQKLGRQHFSHNELHEKSMEQVQEMLFSSKEINFNNLSTVQKRGYCIYRESTVSSDLTQRSDLVVDEEPPIFTQNRTYIEQFVNVRED
jgi:tRNA(His) 5'-end guanylyltransferase